MSDWRPHVQDWKPLIGRTIRSIEHPPFNREYESRVDVVRLSLDNGKVAELRLHGECCSVSYFDPPGQFADLLGATIRQVEDREGWDEGDGDKVAWHFLVFVTHAGHVTLEWRNDSNGYYDGWVELVLQDGFDAA